MSTTTTIPAPLHPDRPMYDNRLGEGLLNVRVETASGNEYVWRREDDTATVYRNGEQYMTNCTMPVWVHLDGGRALYVEGPDFTWFVRTSRVQYAEWFVEHGMYAVSRHEYRYR